MLVFVHGDSFSFSSGSGGAFDGSVLSVVASAIVVTLEFRLGALGWPGAGDRTTPNLALLDLAAALHWLRDNVDAFGGDPDLITLMGEDSGAVVVHCLMASPLSRVGKQGLKSCLHFLMHTRRLGNDSAMQF